MKETSLFVTVVTLVTLLPCQGMPPKIPKAGVSLQKKSLPNTVPDNSVDKPACEILPITEPPSFVIERKIYSERRYFLQMTPDGRINGTTLRTFNNINMIFLLESVGDNGLLRAKGKNVNLYLSMDKKGRFYGRQKPNNESVFKQISTTHGFMAFQSYQYCTKYIGMRRNGELKRTEKPNHSCHFFLI